MQVQNHERDKELYAAFKKALSMEGINSVKEAIDYARNSRASQFFVSIDDAWRYCRAKENGKSFNRSKGSHYIFEMIYQRYLVIREMSEFKGCSQRFVFSFAYTSHAPSFFLSYRRALDIIRSMKKCGKVKPRKRYEERYRDKKGNHSRK